MPWKVAVSHTEHGWSGSSEQVLQSLLHPVGPGPYLSLQAPVVLHPLPHCSSWDMLSFSLLLVLCLCYSPTPGYSFHDWEESSQLSNLF